MNPLYRPVGDLFTGSDIVADILIYMSKNKNVSVWLPSTCGVNNLIAHFK